MQLYKNALGAVDPRVFFFFTFRELFFNFRLYRTFRLGARLIMVKFVEKSILYRFFVLLWSRRINSYVFLRANLSAEFAKRICE